MKARSGLLIPFDLVFTEHLGKISLPNARLQLTASSAALPVLIGQLPPDHKGTKIAHLSAGSSNWFNPSIAH
jgi:hypothetical protein